MATEYPDSAGRRHQRYIAIWLAVCCALVFAMVVVGGVTRLTHSGLSMVEWRPLTGFLPPWSDAEWRETFAHYRQHPEYLQVHAGMSLDGFKGIFWLEFSHRLLGRALGFAFALPLLVFVARRWVARWLLVRLLALFVLGGAQGALGWYMVQSGLADRPDVSHYRLAAHLGLALVLYGYMLWLVLELWVGRTGPPGAWRQRGGLPAAAAGFSAWVFLTAMSGALVAGLDGGFIYNTFPLMDGGFLPPDMLALEPPLANFLDNRATVQFDHRLIAELLVLGALGLWGAALRSGVSGRARLAVHAVAAVAAGQVALGIATLILVVPVPLAALHQAGALVLLSAALWATHELARAP